MTTLPQSNAETFTVLTVYFEGTANPLSLHVTQIGLFADMTDAFDLTSGSRDIDRSNNQFKIAFDGCGVTNGQCK
jgi:hypothetical protein